MAVSAGPGPIRAALRPTRASLRLVALRALVVILASAPALVAGLAGVAGGAARRPYFTDIDGRLPLIHMVRLFQELPKAVLPAILVSVVLAVLADQIVLGGALALFDPDRPSDERPEVFATVCRDGLAHLWPFLRAVGLGLVLSAIGAAIVRRIFVGLGVTAYRSAWSGATEMLTLPLLSTALILVWLASAGAWVFWTRLVTAADGRRCVRRTGVLVLRVFRRHPLRSWGLFVLLTLSSVLLSGAVLVAWRQADPGRGAVAWLALWLCTLLLQAFVWVWLVRAGHLLYASDGLADLRSRPDEPFRIFRRLWGRVRRRKAPPAHAAPEPS